MGVSMDTYDSEYSLHPRNKQLVSSRLAIAGLNVAYGQTKYPTQGPFPFRFEVSIQQTILNVTFPKS